ncbi:HAMP domain-containing sensor histidine kinase [Compostibacter hankyongensis]|uniref:sensor histidine kinase n=1 Tax=Compostibacter hankyongensis TaxID=1007089 RepID=UPI0031EDFBA7
MISIPVFYVVLNRIFIHAIDRDLYQQAGEIPLHQNHIRSESDLALWKTLDNDLEIIPADSVKFLAGPFTEQRTVPGKEGKQDFRILQKKIHMLGKAYVVQIKSSLIEKEDLVQTILLIQLSLFFLMLIGAVGINYFINKKVWSPFYNTLFFLKNFDLEKTAIGMPENTPIQEFLQLNHSVHQLAVGVRNAYLSQKEFAENASHELQTPLAVLRSKLELLLQEKSLSQSQSMLIDDMYKVIDQLEILNNNLLFLSKMENSQFAFNERFDIGQVAAEVADELSFMMDAKSQKLTMHHDTNVSKSGNKSLFKVLITNLLRNAIQHSAKGSIISIQITETHTTIANPGEPLNINKESIFNRFTKGENQRGNGLGLAIAQKIATLHHLRLDYAYREGRHEFHISG